MNESSTADPSGPNLKNIETATTREQLENRNRELEMLVQSRTAELELATRELEALAYSISHDLRAPLRAIDGLSLALEADCAHVLNEQGRQYLAQISSSSRRLNQLIDGVLELSRASRAPLRRQRLDVSKMAATIIRELREKEPGRNTEVIIEPEMFHEADPVLLRLAVQKLLENAWKFTSKRSVSRIELRRSLCDGQMEFFVRDNGAGFDMTYADKLFAPFQRLHAVDEFPGLGIGLAIAQRIIGRHGGRIWVESKLDEGTTFYFRLSPLDPDHRKLLTQAKQA